MRLVTGLGIFACLASACLTPVKDLVVDKPDSGTDAGTDAPADVAAESNVDADLENDARNCGAIGHDCLQGGCSAGKCEAFELASSEFPWRVIALDNHVYWTTHSTVGRVDKDGSDETFLAPEADPSASAGEIATDGTRIFWAYRNMTTDAGGVFALDKAATPGTSPTVIDDGAAVSGVAVDQTHVYWASSVAGEVWRRKKDASSAAEKLATGQIGALSVAVSATEVYWTLDTGGVRRTSKVAPFVVEEVRADQGTDWFVSEVVTDTAFTYWREGKTVGSGGVWRWDQAKHVASELVPNQQAPHGIAVDETHVYWVVFSPGTLLRAPKVPSGTVDVLLYGSKGFDGVTVDEKAIYFTIWDEGKIMGLAK